ncbi:tRNA 2-thiocytidine(32) synthetase TtcA, partial [Vibrio natriegens]
TAMQNVVPSHLADFNLFDFKSINKDSGAIDGGDVAFDKQDIPATPVSSEDVAEFDPSQQLDVLQVN